jgi:hypothetical protein
MLVVDIPRAKWQIRTAVVACGTGWLALVQRLAAAELFSAVVAGTAAGVGPGELQQHYLQPQTAQGNWVRGASAFRDCHHIPADVLPVIAAKDLGKEQLRVPPSSAAIYCAAVVCCQASRTGVPALQTGT